MRTPLAAWLTLALAGVAAEPGLLFRASFDGTLTAEGSAGAVAPVGLPPDARAEFAPGRFGQALVCGPELPLPRYPTHPHLVPAAGTVSLWVKPLNWTPDDPNFHVFVECGTGQDGAGWLLLYKYYQNGSLLLRYADERGQVGMATALPGWQPGEWHHVAATWQREALCLYVDGELAGTAPTPLVAEGLPPTFALGDNGWHVPHAAARTLIDEVRIFGHALAADAIRRLAWCETLVVRRGPSGDRWLATLTVPNPIPATRLVASVAPATGGDALLSATAAWNGQSADVELPVTGLVPGPYLVRAQALDEAGQVVAQATRPMRRLAQERLVLGNERMRLAFDGGSGAVLEIEAPDLGFGARTPGGAPPLFALESVSFARHARFYRDTDVTELPATDERLQTIRVETVDSGQTLVAEYLFPPQVRATLTAHLPSAQGTVTLRLRVENQAPLRPSAAVRIPRLTFPRLAGLRIGAESADDRLACGRIQGELIRDPARALPRERTLQYPGSCCLPWQDLYDERGGLALLPQADGTCQLEVTQGAQAGGVDLGCRWWCLLEPGETWTSPVVEVAVHAGAWHWAADRFRAWALEATPPRSQPAWLGECDGWTGSGGPDYRFRDLPKMLETARSYGFFYLQLWAQMILGGAYYSYFYPNPDLGTVEELRQGLAAVHAAGGKVGFYSNAICFDAAVDGNEALRDTAAKYGLKDMPPLPRFYGEAERSVFVGHDGAFGRGGAEGHSKSGYPDGYWAMDPNAAWWQDYLSEWIRRWHADYGADIWYLDSFPVHGYGLGPASFGLHLTHPRGTGAGQIELLKRIRRDFDGPVLYEGVACAAFMPYTNWCLGTELSFGPSPWARPEIFVYSLGDLYPVFSGTCNTWKGIGQFYPDLKEPRHQDAMNLVFLLGERFDAIGLCNPGLDAAYGEHLRRLVALRRKVRDVVYAGRFLDVRGVAGVPELVEARIFVRQSPPAAVVSMVDRRPERRPWALRLDPKALPWPPGLDSARLLRLDGSETESRLTPAADGTLVVEISAPAEVSALRLGSRGG